MVGYEWKSLEIECPEDYGDANISFKVLLHDSKRGGVTVVDKKAVVNEECDLRDGLLNESKECGFTCKDTETYKRFIQGITAV